MTLIKPGRKIRLCPICRREIEMVAMNKAGGRVTVEFRCPKHGTKIPGYLTALTTT